MKEKPDHNRARRRHAQSSPGNPTAFDRELRQASQNRVQCVMFLGPEDDERVYVLVKYVDQYFIKVQQIEPPMPDRDPNIHIGRPKWINKSAIFGFEIGGGQ